MLPFGRIQAVEVHSGPWQRHYGLASVTVATGSYHRVAVHDVDRAAAESIRDNLTAAARENQVAL